MNRDRYDNPKGERVPLSAIPVEPEPGWDRPHAVCAHLSGIEHVEVTQPQGQKYEWWRCLVCHCEFRPTGSIRPGDGPGELR